MDIFDFPDFLGTNLAKSQGDEIKVYQKLTIDNKIQGYLIVSYQFNFFKRFIINALFITGLVFIVIILMILALGAYLNEHLVGPIESLAKHLRNFGLSQTVDEDKLKFLSNVKVIEFKKIEKEFISMVQRVKQRDSQLLQAKIDLEQALSNTSDALENEKLKSIQSAKLAAVGEMAAGIAHEINNPLQIIVGTNQSLKRRVNDPNLQKSFNVIDSTARRISSIIKSLKKIARDSSQDDFEVSKIEDIVNDVMEFSTQRLKYAKIDIKFVNLESDLKIYCRPIEISQVILNLINNSLDEILDQTNPWIEIRFNRQEDKLQIEFLDSGMGIHEDIVAQMLNPFFSTKSPDKGTGLGLSISNSIIESHGGKFYYSNKYENTCFVIELPMYKTSFEAA